MTYQQRYIAHQARKREVLKRIISERYSERYFSDKPVEASKINDIIQAIGKVPNSCDRHGVSARKVTERDDKDILAGLLVGGVGWLHRAPVILLLIADNDAYVEKLDYMPYLDAGVIINQVYLMATALGLAVCYVNPNVRPVNQVFFRERMKLRPNHIYCGAIAIGYK